MNFCAGMAPEWANEVRHPDMETTEFWHIGGFLSARGTEEVFPVGLVQSGPEGRPLIVLGGLRFSALEAHDCIVSLQSALELAGGWDGQAEAFDEHPD